MRRLVRVGSLLAVLLGGCSGGAVLEQSDLAGYWRLDTIEVDGEASEVEIGVNTVRPAWVLIDGHLEGSAGCNDFHGFDAAPWRLHLGRLVPGEILFTAMLCSLDGNTDAAMTTEVVIQSFLWGAREDGFDVAVTAEGLMTWNLGATTLTFSPADGPVHGPPPPPETGIGRLECSPGMLVRDRVPDTGINGEQILRESVPAVVAVESDPVDWFWWGYDSSGTVIAAVAKGDIVPVVYELFTCKDH